LPPMLTCTQAIAAGDFNGDGKIDLFVGGRLTPRDYPYPTRSYILRNDGGGHFTDVTAQLAPELAQPFGMVTAAVWVDFDGDGKLDLVTAGEWMPLQFFHNEGSQLKNVTATVGIGDTRGWWWSLAVGDFNHDGKPDLIAGNQGLNFYYKTSPQSRLGVYAGDFTGTHTADVVLTQDSGGKEVPWFGRAKLGPVVYPAALRFPTYQGFANASVQDLFGAEQLKRALHYETDTFASLYLQNNGNGTFTATPLPNLAQVAPIRGIVVKDVDGDGNLDLIVAGNLFATEPNTTPADAGNGLWLKGDGRGHFTPVPPIESGFLAPRDVSGLAVVRTAKGTAVLVANTSDSLQTFLLRKP
jgi:enediyne biosynthesis protein E4